MNDRYLYYTFSSFLASNKEKSKVLNRSIYQQQSIGLDILVEDEVAKSILEIALAEQLHVSVRILPIGSAAAVMQHLAMRYKDVRYLKNNVVEVCACLDGDMLSNKQGQIKQFMNALENPYERQLARSWWNERVLFLPGDTWPEAWIFNPSDRQPFYAKFQQELNLSSSEVDNLLAVAASAGKHQEFRTAAEILGVDRAIVTNYLIESAWGSAPKDKSRIISALDRLTTAAVNLSGD
jgi:hypothetical protein